MTPLARWLCSSAFLVCPLASAAQATAPAGKLHITSVPPGATIEIDGKRQVQPTDVTLVVAANRRYRVTIKGGPGRVECTVTSEEVQPRQTVEVSCPASAH